MAAISRHVAGPRLRLADPLVRPVLQEPQQLRLHGRRQVADLVEEQRAALGRGDLALCLGHRAR